MYKKSNRFTTFVWLSLFAAGVLTLSAFVLSGCTDTLEGNIDENLIPLVYFVNIPPEDFSFSHNPEVYWYGTDPDGLIDFYRYCVASEEDVTLSGYGTPAEFAASLDDTMWTYVDVDPSQSNPQTACIIPLSADTLDPVNTFVDQYVFVQAFDNDGAGSLIAARRFNRNDHPPATRLWNVRDTPFVNAVEATSVICGVRLRWEGSDVRDYDEQGLVAPPFEFEWRLYGPFTKEEADSLIGYYGDGDTWMGSEVEKVVVTNDGVVHKEGEVLEFCDDVYDEDLEQWVEVCTTFTLSPEFLENVTSNAYFTADTLIDVSEPEIANRLLQRSYNGFTEWVQDTQDTLYNVFDGYDVGGTTVSREFLFWVRCRDDAFVMDPTAAFGRVPVLEPRHEREVLVLDYTFNNMPLAGLQTPTRGPDVGFVKRKTFWKNLIEDWKRNTTDHDKNLTFEFDTTGGITLPGDIAISADFNASNLTLQKLLQYKVIIITNDGIGNSRLLGYGEHINKILNAIDAGVNCWVTGRAFFGTQAVPMEFTTYFGVAGTFFSDWLTWINFLAMGGVEYTQRIEDFCGAYSLDESLWPPVEVDTALLHNRYYWDPDDGPPILAYAPARWRPDLGAVPEVGWCQRIYGTQPMYLYKSIYGPNHFLGYPYTIEGTPVGHRYGTNMFRTVWFQFTLPNLAEDIKEGNLVVVPGVQSVTKAMLDWLYDPTLGQSTTVTATRYPDAAVKISVEDARTAYDERNAD